MHRLLFAILFVLCSFPTLTAWASTAVAEQITNPLRATAIVGDGGGIAVAAGKPGQGFELLMLFLVLATIVGLVVSLIWWSVSRARKYLVAWAEAKGLEVWSAEKRLLFKGPYFLKSSKNQRVFRIVVSDSSGESHSGWARCGSFWFGVLDRVDVIWDSEWEMNSPSDKSPPEQHVSTRRTASPREFSLKKKSHWFWRTNFTREQVIERLDTLEIGEDWLICPLGESDRAITVKEFISNPGAFGAMNETEIPNRGEA